MGPFPPIFFWVGWVAFSRELNTDPKRDFAKHTHDLGRNIWIAFAGILAYLFWHSPWSRGRIAFGADIAKIRRSSSCRWTLSMHLHFHFTISDVGGRERLSAASKPPSDSIRFKRRYCLNN